MDYTRGDAERIESIHNDNDNDNDNDIDIDIEQQASINNCLANSILMSCSLIHIKPLEK